MNAREWLRVFGILGPIVIMVFVGLVLAIRSGVGYRSNGNQFTIAMKNLSHAMVLLGGCLVSLAFLHMLVGQHIARIW